MPGFTINTSDQLVSYGQSVTISGALDNAALNTPVTLWARNASQTQFTPIADTTTGSGGSYTFAPQAPTDNTIYLEIRFVTNASTFQFGWTFGKAGTYQFRARITGDGVNVGGASSPVAIQVPPLTNPSTLPPAS